MRCVPEARTNGTGEPRHVSYADLRRAVSGFNLVASDELVAQLMQTLDTDHDGLLCLSEFVTGLAADNSVQLVEPPLGVARKTRRERRRVGSCVGSRLDRQAIRIERRIVQALPLPAWHEHVEMLQRLTLLSGRAA